jgi:hypothetical protein
MKSGEWLRRVRLVIVAQDQLQAGASNLFGPCVGSTPATPPVETLGDAAKRKLCKFVEGAYLDG